jgi:hypothetical protein
MQYIPHQGFEDYHFADLQQGEGLLLIGSFAHAIRGEAKVLLEKIYEIWFDTMTWENYGGTPQINFSVQDTSFSLWIWRASASKEALRQLINEIKRSPLQLTEVYISKRYVLQDGSQGDVINPPHIPIQEVYLDPTQWWEAGFNTQFSAPMSEPINMPQSTAIYKDQKIFELKDSRLFLPDVRVVYGVAGANYISPSKYCATVMDVIKQHFKTYFNELPTLTNRHGKSDKVDLLFNNHRLGYAFYVPRQQMVANYSTSFRFREYEMMLSLRDAINHLHLSPTIHWTKDKAYLINLWEKWVYEQTK